MSIFASIWHRQLLRHFFSVLTALMLFAVISSVRAQPILPGTYVTLLNWSEDGSLLAYSTGQIIPPWGDYGSGGGSARVIEPSGTTVFSLNFPYPIDNVEVSPSGNLVLIGSFSEVYNLTTQELVVGRSDSMAFIDGTWHPTSDLLLLTAVWGTRIYDPVNRETLGGLGRGQLPNNPSNEGKTVTSVWSPDGLLAATSTTMGSIFIWDTTSEVGTVQTTFSAHTAAVQHLVWNAETNLIASGDASGKIWVWNPATGQPILELPGHVGAILALDWRSDGQQLVSSGLDGTVRVWDWPSGAMQVVASGNIVSALAYSPDGTELAYAGEVTDPDAVSITTVPVQSLVQPTPTPTITPPTPTPTHTPPPVPFKANAGPDRCRHQRVVVEQSKSNC